MTLPVVFRPVAKAELEEAIIWYEKRKPGLGFDFRRVVEHELEQIAATPLRFRPVDQHTRRALLRRFPYAVHFAVEPKAIVVLAVFHTHRDPQLLRGRN
jgi:plasmid stabilization system protein ParE